MSYWISKSAYNFTWIPWYLLFRFFLRLEVVYENRRVRRAKGPLIIAANHSSWLDPFLLSAIFPIFSPAFPIRFATYHRFFWYFHSALFVRLYGCFKVRRGAGIEKVLAPALGFLKEKQVVGIFPEGRRRNLGRPRKGRRGAAYLAVSSGAPILPARIEGNRGIDLRSFLLRKHRVTVCAGSAFRLPKDFDNETDIEQLNKATKMIMERINEVCRPGE